MVELYKPIEINETIIENGDEIYKLSCVDSFILCNSNLKAVDEISNNKNNKFTKLKVNNINIKGKEIKEKEKNEIAVINNLDNIIDRETYICLFDYDKHERFYVTVNKFKEYYGTILFSTKN